MGKTDDKPSSVQVYPDGMAVLERARTTFGVGKAELVTRLLNFFDKRSRAAQVSLLDKDGDAIAELVRERFAEIAAASEDRSVAELSLEDCTRVIRLMTERIEQIELARKKQFGSEALKRRKG